MKVQRKSLVLIVATYVVILRIFMRMNWDIEHLSKTLIEMVARLSHHSNDSIATRDGELPISNVRSGRHLRSLVTHCVVRLSVLPGTYQMLGGKYHNLSINSESSDRCGAVMPQNRQGAALTGLDSGARRANQQSLSGAAANRCRAGRPPPHMPKRRLLAATSVQHEHRLGDQALWLFAISNTLYECMQKCELHRQLCPCPAALTPEQSLDPQSSTFRSPRHAPIQRHQPVCKPLAAPSSGWKA